VLAWGFVFDTMGRYMNLKGKKIFVGLSGGVDSAVSAALLQKAGADVTGVFIKGWYPPGMPCTWANERRDAMQVAARLHIPFRTLDASIEYKKGVIEYLINEYRAGRTPNPDVMCNKEVKFGAFYRFAKEAGADAIATGHYRSGAKNQSYFLWAVPKDVLEDTIFPIGHMEKRDVRALAKRFSLPVAEKRDSQGICFLGSISVEEFLRSEFGIFPGRAITEDGQMIGGHDGVLLYTLGERVALRDVTGPGPWFVLAKDVARNELIVGKTRVLGSSTADRNITFATANWFSEPVRVTEAQYRYRGPRVPGHIEGDRFVCAAMLPEIPTPGQSIVFYRDDELVGGGIIVI
jgi:tRNA-specific 2-thiouridylase